MTAKKVEYPAKLVGYRIDVVNDHIVLFEDVPVLFNDKELERRRGTYRGLEQAGGIPYTFELFSLEDLEAAKADIRADLEQLVAGTEETRARACPRLLDRRGTRCHTTGESVLHGEG